jgi:hypothetical protein
LSLFGILLKERTPAEVLQCVQFGFLRLACMDGRPRRAGKRERKPVAFVSVGALLRCELA